MDLREASQVARRTLCLELLLQRLGLETDGSMPAAEREKIRAMWQARRADLGVEAELLGEEIAWLERPVGGLSDDELDDLHARVVGAPVLLWALGRLAEKPGTADQDRLVALASERGLLVDGIARAREAAASATLRGAAELDEACAAYERTRGKSREATEPDKIIAEIAAHHLAWVLDPTMTFG